MVKRPGRRPMGVSLIILAGGKGRRMKADKASLPIPGGTLIRRVLLQVEGMFDEVLVSVSRGQAVDAPGCRTIEDTAPGQGPLAGILAGLKAAKNQVCVVLACDIPDIDIDFLKQLIAKAQGFEIVVPVSCGGLFEPLFAVYRRSVIPEIEALVRARDFSILTLFDRCRTRKVMLKDSGWLRNLNTPEDYEKYLREFRKGPERIRTPGKKSGT
ncbi:MAG: molybdenum cofactor guanylyltransferase [Candidatus Aminicenantes bacterium]|nr:molybdenum cofactor guanylyltransferase [Candidatus Aminicenantes bacterium]